jgi:hypothetical protein
MKKLSLCLFKGLVVFFVFWGSNVGFAIPTESKVISSLIGNVSQQSVNIFKTAIEVLVQKLQNKLKTCNKKERIELEIAYLLGLVEIVRKALKYQQNPTQQLQVELDGYAKTYGGKVRELIWSVIHPPAPAP